MIYKTIFFVLQLTFFGNAFANYVQLEKCNTTISDSIESCANIFSTQNRSEVNDLFKDLENPESRRKFFKKHFKRIESIIDITIPTNEMDIDWLEELKCGYGNTIRERKKGNKTRRYENKMGNEKKRYEKGRKGKKCSPGNRYPLGESESFKDWVCLKLYIASVIDLLPFSFHIQKAIDDTFQRCCEGDAAFYPLQTVNKLSKLNGRLKSLSDIIFPVLGKRTAKQINGYHFLPIIDAPTAYYFTKRQSKDEVTSTILSACGDLWPLLAVCLLLAIISGCVAWMFERWTNEVEFPKPFFVGLFEGFWWSFISMTTVGYGDKAPKSHLGRIFSILWILVGITICSMFTASLTTEITKGTSSQVPTMSGETIGALESRLFDALIIARQGGIIKEVQHHNISEGFKKMEEKLEKGEIKGFVIDAATYHYYTTWYKTSGRRDRCINDGIRRTEVTYSGEKLSFGILIKDEKDFKFFENYIIENQLYLEACYYFKMNEKTSEREVKKLLMDPSGGFYIALLYYCIVPIVGLILIIGTIYECRRDISSGRKVSNAAISLKALFRQSEKT